MVKFNNSKNGYDKKEVDDYIFELSNTCEERLKEQKSRIDDLKADLQTANEQLEIYKEKNSNISDALIVAVETAKQIENSSKTIYELEIKRIRSLYDKWKSFLDDFMKRYPELQAKYDTNILLDIFKQDIDKILNQNKKTMEQKEAVANQFDSIDESNTIGLRMLINKMSSENRATYSKDSTENSKVKLYRRPKPTEQTMAKYKVDLSFEDEEKRLMKDKIKPISNLELDNNENYENLVDKFLTNDDEDYSNAYSKILLEKQKNDGFSLREAVTPTQNLDEIMKSFSFYPDNDEDKDNN